MNDFAASSDLCEENGFGRSAEVLRQIAAHDGHAFILIERNSQYNDEYYDLNLGGEPNAIFFDEAEAEAAATAANIRWHRMNHIRDYFYDPDDIGEVTDLTSEQLDEEIGAILGRPFQMVPEDGPAPACFDEPLIPPDATDEQAARIADLFAFYPYYVEKTRFAPPDAPEDARG